MTFGRFIARRLAHAAFVVAASASLGFTVLHLVPGDAASMTAESAAGDVRSRAESRATMRARLGLDQPLSVQYVRYLARIAQGDLGMSMSERRPVVDALRPALANSLLLCGSGLLLAVIVGGGVGILQGWRPESRAGRLLGNSLTALYSVPEFVLAVALIAALAYRARLFPVGGLVDPVLGIVGSTADQVRDRLWHLVLPAITLALGWGATVARQQRVALLATAGADYVRTARAKGVSEWTLLRRHALPPSLPATVAVIGSMLPVVVGGAVVVESLFAWPGMGTLMLRAIGARDYPLLGGAVVAVGIAVSISSLIVDVLVARLDPRQPMGVT